MGEKLPVPQRLIRRLPVGARVGLAGLGLIGGLGGLAGCGPAKGGETQIQPPPAAAAEMASPTAKSDLATAVPTAAPTEAPKPTIEAVSNEQALNGLNSLINLIQNPNPQLIAACNPQPHLLKQDQELIIYGDRELPDPNQYQEQKFTQPGLVDVKASLEQGDKAKANEQLATIWQRISNPIGCAAGKDEFVRWNAKEIETQDPQRQFIPSAAKLTIVSEIKQEAVKQFLKLWYGLASANLK